MIPGEFVDLLILLGILLLFYRDRQRWREYEEQMDKILELVEELEEKLAAEGKPSEEEILNDLKEKLFHTLYIGPVHSMKDPDEEELKEESE